MAEITTNSKKYPRVDMTPLVDLGFLLITFFVFTSTFNTPFIMRLNMPKQGEGTSITSASNTLTLILGKDNRLFYHQSAAKNLNPEAIKETDYSRTGIRSLIIDAKKNAKNPDNFVVVIKPTDDANYKNTVDVLDEMTITNCRSYAIADLLADENSAYLQKIELP